MKHATPNMNAKHLRENANARPRALKFGAQGTWPSGTVAEAGQSRNPEASSDEEDWPGCARRSKFQAGVKTCIATTLNNASPPNKNSGFARDGAISAPRIDPSVEISPCKL